MGLAAHMYYRQVAEYIAECARVLEKTGLKYKVRRRIGSIFERTSRVADTNPHHTRCSE